VRLSACLTIIIEAADNIKNYLYDVLGLLAYFMFHLAEMLCENDVDRMIP
jgi:hypothetical protein